MRFLYAAKFSLLHHQLSLTMSSSSSASITPSGASYLLSGAILGVLAGYFLGQASFLGLFSHSAPVANTRTKSTGKDKRIPSSEVDSESELEDEDEDSENGGAELKVEEYDLNEDQKMVLVVRTDLGMTKGKRSSPICASTIDTTFI
jgi:PTH2 family peptidyl-tRNA hydrolase